MLDELVNGGVSRFVTVRVEDIYNRTRDLIGNWRVDRTIGGGPGDTIESLVWSLTPDPQEVIYDFEGNMAFSAEFSTTVSSVQWLLDNEQVSTYPNSNVSSTSFGPVQNLKRGHHTVRLKIITMDSLDFDFVWQFWVFPKNPLHLLIGKNKLSIPNSIVQLIRTSALSYAGDVSWNATLGAYEWMFLVFGVGHATGHDPATLYRTQKVTATELSNLDALEVKISDGDVGYGTSHSKYPVMNAIATVAYPAKKLHLIDPSLMNFIGEFTDMTNFLGGCANTVSVILENNDDVSYVLSEHLTYDSEIWHYAFFTVSLNPNDVNLHQGVKISIKDKATIANIGTYGPEVEFEVTLPSINKTPTVLFEELNFDTIVLSENYGIDYKDGVFTVNRNHPFMRPNIVLKNAGEFLYEELNY
jgi:hypothetical protein